MDCEIIETCIFFNDKMQDMPAMADIFKKNYCRGDNTECARYVVYAAIGRENVPQDLFPNQHARAKEILG
jgi:hypothetical protein